MRYSGRIDISRKKIEKFQGPQSPHQDAGGRFQQVILGCAITKLAMKTS